MTVRQRAVALLAVAAVSGISLVSAARPAGPQFQRVYPLKPAEGVFAYARISPDGKLLAYAS